MRVARAAAGAVAFLTVVPVGRAIALGPDDVARGAALFPLVGAGIGASVGGVLIGLSGPLPALAAATIAVATGVVLTGAMHLDALADSADALGARTREAALEIMRDPRTGSFGVVALTLDLLTKVVVLAALTESFGAVIAAVAASRAAAPALAVVLPAARPGGSGAELARRAGPVATAAAAAIALAIAAVAAGWPGVAICAVAAVVATVVGLGARLRFGGVTGDVLGAGIELAETAGLLAAVALTS